MWKRRVRENQAEGEGRRQRRRGEEVEEEKGGGLERGVGQGRRGGERGWGRRAGDKGREDGVQGEVTPPSAFLRSRAQRSSKITEKTVWDRHVGFMASNSNTDIVLTEVSCSYSQ